MMTSYFVGLLYWIKCFVIQTHYVGIMELWGIWVKKVLEIIQIGGAGLNVLLVSYGGHTRLGWIISMSLVGLVIMVIFPRGTCIMSF